MNRVKSGTIKNIQFLRAVAAMFVVAVHFSRVDWDRLGQPLMFGHYGVDIFFVISGFVMVLTTANRPTTPTTFMKDRVIRIAPLYWTLTIMVYVLALAAPRLLHDTGTDIVGLIKSLLFIPYHKRIDADPMPVLFPGWTLNYEMFFYLLFAISLMINDRRWRFGILLSVLIGLYVIGETLSPNGVLAHFYTASIMLDFVWGIAIGLLYPRLIVWRLSPMIGAASILIGGVIMIFLLPPMAVVAMRGLQVGVVASLIVVGALILEIRGYALRSKVPLLLGASSYALYLTHPFSMVGVEIVARRLGMITGATLPLLMIVTFALTTLVAIAAHLGLEKPLDRLLRKRFAVPSRAASTTPAPLAPLAPNVVEA